MRVVKATTSSGLEVSCNVQCCAERRLIDLMKHKAAIRGVQRHRVTHWISAQIDCLYIERFTKAGVSTFCTPCILCRIALDRYHIRWHAIDRDCGEVNEQTAPASIFTHRQRNLIFKKTDECI